MARLILKSPYLKYGGSNSVSGYLKYIGTRERVELLPDDRPPTRKQEQLVKKLTKDFPEAKKLDEYSDYEAKHMLPPVRSCVRLWWKGQHPGTLRKLLAMCSPCGQRLARTFGGDIFRGKTAWAAVPEQQFCGSNPTISASRKKY